MQEYSSRRFFALAALAFLFPGGALYGAWASVTHNFPFCESVISSPSSFQMNIENLTRASKFVVIGSISQVGPSWEAPNTEVFTDIVITASDYLKYAPGENLTQLRFQTAGGTIGCYSYIHSGEPRVAINEQVLLFLQLAPYETLRVTGGLQGKYVIVGETAYWGDPGDPKNTVSLDSLIAEIKQYI